MTNKRPTMDINDNHNPFKKHSKYNLIKYLEPIKSDKTPPWSRLEKPLQFILTMDVMTKAERQLFWYIFLDTRGWITSKNAPYLTQEGVEIEKRPVLSLTGMTDMTFDRALMGLWKKQIIYLFNDKGEILPIITKKEGNKYLESFKLFTRKEDGIQVAINFRLDTWNIKDKVKERFLFMLETMIDKKK